MIPLIALIDLLRKKRTAPLFAQARRWAQGLAALLIIATVFVSPAITAIPACLLGLCFACFQLAEQPRHTAETTVSLPPEQLTALEKSAASAWQFFQKHLSKDEHALPTDAVHADSAASADQHTSPWIIAAGILACICAHELGLISSVEAALRILRMHDALHLLPMHHNLPHHSYTLPTLQTADDTVDSREVGLLLCALMTAAQAIRSWIPELPVKYISLPDALDRTAAAMDVSALYCPDSDLFCDGLNASDQPFGRIASFTDDALLLSIASCALKHIPPGHFSRLQRPVLERQGEQLPLPLHVTDSGQMMAPFFIPSHPEIPIPFIQSVIETNPENDHDEAQLHAASAEEYSAVHQSIILISAAHVLCDAPVMRWFCARPDVRSVLPLLDRAQTVVLPDLPLPVPNDPQP